VRKVFLEVGRQLEERRPEPRPEEIGGAHEVLQLLAALLETLEVRDLLRCLQDEGEILRHLLGPLEDEFFGRHAVEGVVDLNGLETARVERKEAGRLEVGGIERALPLLVRVAARPYSHFHPRKTPGNVRHI